MNVKLIATTAAFLSSLPMIALANPTAISGQGGKEAEIAQQKQVTVTGVVQDEDGMPIIGATIRVKNNDQKGTITDQDGQFRINCQPSDILVFSSIGFQTAEEKVQGKKILAVTLRIASQEMSDKEGIFHNLEFLRRHLHAVRIGVDKLFICVLRAGFISPPHCQGL